MFKRILGTAGSKIIIAVISLLIVLFNARFLGAEGVGTIGLIVLGITIILLFNSFVGGSILVYLVPREENFKLVVISYLWAFIVVLLFWVAIQFIEFVPAGYEIHVLLLSLMFSLSNINLYLLLGREKIKAYNLITMLQFLMQLAALLLFFPVLKWYSVMAFIYTLYFSYGFTLLSSSFLAWRMIRVSDLRNLRPLIREILRLGSMVQVAYTVQLMNYRLSYYIIEHYIGRAGVGMYHLGNQLAEGTWVLGKSVAIVQYSKISNTTDMDYARRLTLRLMKLTFLATLAMLAVMLALPDKVFTLFGKDFSDTRLIILSLAVGILANAVAMMFSHYFAGRGKPHINTIASSIGFVFTLSLGLYLIPRHGIVGAGITASASYFFAMLFEIILFAVVAKPKAREFLITMDDYRMLKDEFQKLLKKEELKKESLPEHLP